MCLLIIGLVVTGCGSASNNGSLNNPVISSVTPDGRNSTITSDNTVSDGIRVTLCGANFGNSGSVWYNPSSSSNGSVLNPVRMSSNVSNGISWNDTQICFTLVNTTKEIYPTGTFTVENSSGNKTTSYLCEFNGGNLKDAIVSNISPKIIYDSDNSRTIIITGSGFGNETKTLVLYNMSTGQNLQAVTPLVWSDKSIMFVVPDGLTNSTANIGIKINEESGFLGNNYENSIFKYVSFPTSIEVSPNRIIPGNTVTLNGNFGDTANFSVHLKDSGGNSSLCSITQQTSSYICVTTPNQSYFQGGVGSIVLKSNSHVAREISCNITLLIPQLTAISAKKTSDGVFSNIYTYSINGNYFTKDSEVCVKDYGSGMDSPVNLSYADDSQLSFSSSSNLANKYLYVKNGVYKSNTLLIPDPKN